MSGSVTVDEWAVTVWGTDLSFTFPVQGLRHYAM